ncbi:MAG: hypothetical protein ACXWSD_07755 [Bdellovibrionota bacterium]
MGGIGDGRALISKCLAEPRIFLFRRYLLLSFSGFSFARVRAAVPQHLLEFGPKRRALKSCGASRSKLLHHEIEHVLALGTKGTLN